MKEQTVLTEMQTAVIGDIEQANSEAFNAKINTSVLAGLSIGLLWAAGAIGNVNLSVNPGDDIVGRVVIDTAEAFIFAAPRVSAIFTALGTGIEAVNGINALMRKNSLIGCLTTDALRTKNVPLLEQVRKIK